ncbi:putative Beta-lactamase [metagenome]|uniref:Putative Beta-lactamase n=1 Tax=metagenome TaxID=256318 RepID=A0A2P2CCP3_9ZZZZ
MTRAQSPGLGGLSFVNPQDPGGSGAGIGRTYAEIPAARPAVRATPLPRAVTTSLDDLVVEIDGAGRRQALADFVSSTASTSLVVLVGGEVFLEWYVDGVGGDDLLLGASVTKSALAGLVGQAVLDGAMTLDDPVIDHVPELAGSGYRSVTLRQVASMTSGIDWVEDHRDPESQASRLLGCFADGVGGSRDLLTGIAPHAAPGTRYAYCTADSQVLDWARERATGQRFTSALTELWTDLGCEHHAVVALDGPEESGGVAMAGGGLAATARDWARIGMLQVDGTISGVRLLGQDWVEESSRPAASFTAPGRLPSTLTTHAGFGLHWWPLDGSGRHVTADGSRGQFVYVDRETGTVVVKTSQWAYDEPTDRQCRDLSYLALPRIAQAAAAAMGTAKGTS